MKKNEDGDEACRGTKAEGLGEKEVSQRLEGNDVTGHQSATQQRRENDTGSNQDRK